MLVRDGHSQSKLMASLLHHKLIGSFIHEDNQKKITVYLSLLALREENILYVRKDGELY
ncbi:MAG: hypothetical protein WDZ72_02560 [Cyclobacteriaceae bacterium]